ncbi:MAG: hypothetical protein N0E38_12120 [Candidatus Thiodiazotropha endolucinida]|nr:hypothetical protein [Candidatus Thiodiazotropha endolucinida]
MPYAVAPPLARELAARVAVAGKAYGLSGQLEIGRTMCTCRS